MRSPSLRPRTRKELRPERTTKHDWRSITTIITIAGGGAFGTTTTIIIITVIKF